MQSSVICESRALQTQLEDLFGWAEEVDLAYAWLTTSKGSSAHWCALDLAKLRRAIIGTQGAKTEPWALSELAKLGPDCLRLRLGSSDLFHPKVVLARRGEQRRAIVGSSNFTCRGFGGNVELNVHLTGKATDKQFQAIERFIDHHWEEGRRLRDDWLVGYTLEWELQKRQRAFVPGAPLEMAVPDLLDLSWKDYVRMIASREGRTLESGYPLRVRGDFPSYYGELARARAVFRRGVPFAKLPLVDRQMLMGYGPNSCGLIGRMRVARTACQLVNDQPARLGRPLDRLPLTGKVDRNLLVGILKSLTGIDGVKLGIASRLLTVKRPDLFVSVNNGSKPRLRQLLGGRRVATMQDYLDVLDLVWATRWHRAPRPADRDEATLWRRRAALLDAALYEEFRP